MISRSMFMKYLVIGKFKEADIPLYSLSFFRFWLARRLIANPLEMTGPTGLNCWGARLLGTKIGSRVFLQTGLGAEKFDLVEIEDDVVRKHKHTPGLHSAREPQCRSHGLQTTRSCRWLAATGTAVHRSFLQRVRARERSGRPRSQLTADAPR